MVTISKKSVAILVVNWNGLAYTKVCIKSLRKINYPNFEIILVDNSSIAPEGEELKREFPEIHLIQASSNLGFTGGNNLGIRYALNRGVDYILLLNNDTEVEPDFLDGLVSFLDTHPEYAAVQPKIRFALDKNLIWNAGGGYFQPLEMSWSIGIGQKDIGQYDLARDVPWITGCAILVKSEAILEAGMLDDAFFAYYEDVEWSIRLRKKGYKLFYFPQSVIYHVAGASSTQEKTKEGKVSPFVHYLRTRNHLYLIRKHGTPFSFLLSLGYQSLKNSAFVVFLLLRGRIEKAKAILSGHKMGLTGKMNDI